ncbi:glycerol-3-phosphate responsive antiterminator [Isachenkonia alkalipeptolytica]|uniref:Glycerol-3-phosphate responsive antiterminator n=1 Tax=Isachenkonia alkalipeptolytica TaxID=2565777 RepID=A0AA44BEK1_9CLOT|nr:glycerol-3-phosphate responsive antiterminator [Isachenkonia alkalipeptolytica]NBG88290.1 glycerol-3-phosphate responsive antiterminator [Isachenkonia alkalipeptolytica]
MKENIYNHIESNPVIAAVQNIGDVDAAVNSNVGMIILMCADIMNAEEMVVKIRNSGKLAVIHMDFLDGIGRDQKAVEYVATTLKPDGIISTRNSHIKHAKQCGIFTIQRFFLIDNKSYETALVSVKANKPDMIEVMPGVMPTIIKRITKELSIPIIAGGLISTKQDIMEALEAGAIAASTGKARLWDL